MLTSKEILHTDIGQLRFKTDNKLSIEFCSLFGEYLENHFEIDGQKDSNGFIYFWPRGGKYNKILFWFCWDYYEYSLILNYQKDGENKVINLLLENLDSDWCF